MYVSMHMSCCCFTCNFVKFVCSRKANFYVIIDSNDYVIYILYSVSFRAEWLLLVHTDQCCCHGW